MEYPSILGVSAVFRLSYNTVLDTIYEMNAGKDEGVAIMATKGREKKKEEEEENHMNTSLMMDLIPLGFNDLLTGSYFGFVYHRT